MSDYMERMKQFVKDNIEDKAPPAGDDSIQPTTSPIEFLPFAEGAALAGKGISAGAKALAAPAEGIIGNEIGSIGRQIPSALPNLSQMLEKAGATKLENGVAAAAPEMSATARLAKAAADHPENPELYKRLSNLPAGSAPAATPAMSQASKQFPIKYNTPELMKVAAERDAATNVKDAAIGTSRYSALLNMLQRSPASKLTPR